MLVQDIGDRCLKTWANISQVIDDTLAVPMLGQLLRELVLDPNRDYQPTGAPKGPTNRPPN